MSPTRRPTERDIQKTPIFAPTASARSLFSQTLHAENVVTILKGVNHFLIQRTVFLQGRKCCFLATDALSKLNSGRLPWQPAGKK